MQVFTTVSNRRGNDSRLTVILPLLPCDYKLYFVIVTHNYDIFSCYHVICCLEKVFKMRFYAS